ncbi:hypothetical protein GX48_02047 [Paracoccidioides brasiliensis]|nr:hypothetical protein GX48_02047 [Paracoccidioides brasiliensis]
MSPDGGGVARVKASPGGREERRRKRRQTKTSPKTSSSSSSSSSSRDRQRERERERDSALACLRPTESDSGKGWRRVERGSPGLCRFGSAGRHLGPPALREGPWIRRITIRPGPSLVQRALSLPRDGACLDTVIHLRLAGLDQKRLNEFNQ